MFVEEDYFMQLGRLIVCLYLKWSGQSSSWWVLMAALMAPVKKDSRQRWMWHCNMSQHSSQAVANECCAQHSYANIQTGVKNYILWKICAMFHFEPRHVCCTHSYKALHLPITDPGAPSPTPAPPPHPTPPWPINTSQSPVTDGCRGQQGLARAGRGLAKVRPGHRGVWDCCDMACLSVSMQVDE